MGSNDGYPAATLDTLLTTVNKHISLPEELCIPVKLEVVFEGSVLWLQGKELSPQPFVDEHGNILLWNGDILAGYEIPDEQSDTQYISNVFVSAVEEEMLSFLGHVKGPWSFIYYRKDINRLYFGRDMFGRHSLLWQMPNETENLFMVTSVFPRQESIQEVPALGVYYIDLNLGISSDISVYLIPWSHVDAENLCNLESVVKVRNERIFSPVEKPLNKDMPSENVLESFLSLPSTPGAAATEHLYHSMKDQVDNLLKVLECAVQRRVDKCPPRCQACSESQTECEHSKIAVLFSGGLDSGMIALLLDTCFDAGESIDLLNVAFAKRGAKSANTKTKKMKSIELAHDEPLDFEVPDRITGRECWQQLQEIRPNRKWNFVEINVTSEELAKERESTICHLVAPLNSVLDDSIGCALWFGGQGQGSILGTPYTCPARVLLCGMGADEQLGGYARHRGRFNTGGWTALLEEISMEISRIHTRNLGRDNRILADHGRAPRFPYLDEDVVSTLNELPVWVKANLNMPRGLGEKLILRTAAAHLGLTTAAWLPKRAIQFGSRIAKLENSKEKGSDSCRRLVETST